ncbi:hypothetical protein [Methylobacterium fujisawaense]
MIGESVPSGFLWFFALIGWLACSLYFGNIVAALLRPLWKEAAVKDKKIKLVSAAAAVLAFLLATASFFYTIRQVDAVSDRLVSLEKTVEVLKARTGGELKPGALSSDGTKTGEVSSEKSRAR